MVVAQAPLADSTYAAAQHVPAVLYPGCRAPVFAPMLGSEKLSAKTRSTKLERRVKMEIIHNAFGSST
jgi:hypothetical protein